MTERWSANPTVSFLRRWAAACGRSVEFHFDAAAQADAGSAPASEVHDRPTP